MKKKNEFPSSRELAKWEREMKAAGLWPQKVPVYNVAKPRVKARKTGSIANSVSVRPVSQGQNMDIKDLMAGNKVHRTLRWE
jgi:hypothetical protein